MPSSPPVVAAAAAATAAAAIQWSFRTTKLIAIADDNIGRPGRPPDWMASEEAPTLSNWCSPLCWVRALIQQKSKRLKEQIVSSVCERAGAGARQPARRRGGIWREVNKQVASKSSKKLNAQLGCSDIERSVRLVCFCAWPDERSEGNQALGARLSSRKRRLAAGA